MALHHSEPVKWELPLKLILSVLMPCKLILLESANYTLPRQTCNLLAFIEESLTQLLWA